MKDLLQIDAINVHYQDNPVLTELSLTLSSDTILCLLGASGCGKTTLLKAIAGLYPVSQGAIRLYGNDITHQESVKRGIGLIFQDYALFPHLNVMENIAFGLSAYSVVERKNIINEMLELTGLTALAERYPHQLSGGQQQRVAIARSLACRPKLLLLDEPFSNIDTQVRLQLIEDIKQILKKQKTPAIFVTHSKEEAFLFADKIALMQQGKIVQYGDPVVLYQQPQSRFVADFLGQSNYLKTEWINEQTCQTALGIIKYPQHCCLANGRILTENTSLYSLYRPQELALAADLPTNGTILHQRFLGHNFSYRVMLDSNEVIEVYSSQLFQVNEKVQVKTRLSTPLLFEEHD